MKVLPLQDPYCFSPFIRSKKWDGRLLGNSIFKPSQGNNWCFLMLDTTQWRPKQLQVKSQRILANGQWRRRRSVVSNSPLEMKRLLTKFCPSLCKFSQFKILSWEAFLAKKGTFKGGEDWQIIFPGKSQTKEKVLYCARGKRGEGSRISWWIFLVALRFYLTMSCGDSVDAPCQESRKNWATLILWECITNKNGYHIIENKWCSK